MSAEITVVVPHLRQWAQLDQCLASLHRQTLARGRFAVIVVDNGSPDFEDLQHRLASQWPDAVFTQEREPGPGPARNTGIALAGTPLIACIDADCVADERWLASALQALQQAGPGTIHGGDVRIAMTNPASPTAIEAYEAVFGFRQQLYIEKKHFTGTGNMAFWKSDFERTGPFAGIGKAEDRDWGNRAVRCGLRIAFVPDMIIFHPARPDFGSLQQKWLRHVAHDLEAARRSMPALMIWPMHAGAVALSALPHLAMIWRSPHLRTVKARAKASGVLFRIRLFRAREMLRQMALSKSEAGRWNR